MAESLTAAMTILRQNKLKITKQRHALLEFLLTNQAHYTDVVTVDFICQNCGKVIELQMCPMDFFTAQLPDCKITGHSFELYGICGTCQAAGVKETTLVKN